MANGNLISGAYAAAGGGISGYGLGAAAGWMGISDAASKAVSNVVQKRHERFQKFADWELGRKEGTMSTPEFEKLRERLNKRRNQFIWAGKKDREMLMRELQVEKTENDKKNSLKKELAKYIKNQKNGLSDKWMTSDVGESYLNALENPPIFNEDTQEYEYEVLDENGDNVKISTVDMISELKKNLKDGGTQDLINTLVNGSANGADASLPNDNGIFQYDKNYRNVLNQVVGKGNYKSMVNDPDILIDGRVFKEDLAEMISNNTYEELGIKGGKIKRFDPTPKTPVTPEDAMVIAEELLKNERLGKKYLATYVTNHLERNWISDNTNAGNPKNTRNTIIQSSQYKPTGEPSDEGVYEIPGDENWDYKMIDGRWHTRKKNDDGDWTDLTQDEKYKSSIDKLNKYFPDANKPSSYVDMNEFKGFDLGDGKSLSNTQLKALANLMNISVPMLLKELKERKNDDYWSS